jgi:hypothetical protein
LNTLVPTLSRDSPFLGGFSVRWIGRASFDGRTTDMETPFLSVVDRWSDLGGGVKLG